MHVFKSIVEVRSYVNSIKSTGKTIGFVPTMGALHAGHIELVKRAVQETDEVIASIFVNPIQFNNPLDLEKYPKTLESDLEMLAKVKCSAVFVPSVEEMYPEPDLTEFDFGKLDKVMEGKFRPGHFRGVGIVVKKFFEIVTPDKAYFGEKDYQQLVIIKHMVKQLDLPVEIVPSTTVRESDGLAMSSRNTRLTADERGIAPEIYATLIRKKEDFNWFTPEGLGKLIIGEIEQNPQFRVEYAEVVDSESLMPFEDWEDAEHARVCIAVFLGQVRLIDNIELY
jgi:pantoate--beta-alanine ligase